MEPPKPGTRAKTLQAAPAATPAEYEEYERLLSQRYTKEPSAGGLEGTADPDEARLRELAQKLFGTQ